MSDPGTQVCSEGGRWNWLQDLAQWGAVVLVALNLTRGLGLFRPTVGNKQIKTQL
jgi:hypothetical protein